MSLSMDLTTEQHRILLGLLGQYLAGVSVWAFGSRVKGTARADSDLDLVVFSTPEQFSSVQELREAFDESSLPFSVDVLIWNDISESFRKNISEKYSVVASVL